MDRTHRGRTLASPHPRAPAGPTCSGLPSDLKEVSMPTDLQTCFELEQAKSRYCRMMDMKDWAGVADLFAEDLVFDLGGGHDAAPISGRDAALQAVQSSIVDAVAVH